MANGPRKMRTAPNFKIWLFSTIGPWLNANLVSRGTRGSHGLRALVGHRIVLKHAEGQSATRNKTFLREDYHPLSRNGLLRVARWNMRKFSKNSKVSTSSFSGSLSPSASAIFLRATLRGKFSNRGFQENTVWTRDRCVCALFANGLFARKV